MINIQPKGGPLDLQPFKLERYFADYEFRVPFNLCASDCESMTIGQLLQMEENAAERFEKLWLGYTESAGHPDLRAAIAALYTDTAAEDVLVHSGAEEAIYNAMHVLLKPGDHVVVHTPCYQSLWEIARSIGCRVTAWQADSTRSWSLDLDVLRRRLQPDTRLVVVNLPHNPTGYLMPQQMWRELIDLSQNHGFVLFSDEVYRLLEYRGTQRLPAACDLDDRAISLGVMSKSMGLAGLRIGWIATRDGNLHRKLAGFKDYTTICNSAPSEYLATVALKHRNTIVARNLDIIRANLKILNAFFARHADRFDWQPPNAGPIAFPALKGENVDGFCQNLLQQHRVLLLPGTLYGPGYNHFRIGFGRSDLPAGVQAFEQYLK